MNRLFDYVKRKRRQQLRQRIIKVWAKNVEAVSVLKNFNRIQQGRPCIEVDLLKLLSAIIKIIQSSTAADDRRRMERLCSISTLDDLRTKLKNMGYSLGQNGWYRRLLPRRGKTSEGKSHVNTVPDKALRKEMFVGKKIQMYVFQVIYQRHV